jgi:hypothetical protein
VHPSGIRQPEGSKTAKIGKQLYNGVGLPGSRTQIYI